jgi:ATP-dependent RNA helicase RhlE
MNFQELNLIEPIQKALIAENYITPTPIQAKAIPAILQSRDVLACAQTGTGKTAAFAIPIIQLLTVNTKTTGNKSKPIRALILTPTRELAIQIGENFKSYARYTSVQHTVIFGGVSQKPQTDSLVRGTDVLIATPGRLLDLINQGFIHLKNLEIFVLDEADRMLDMGFVHDVKKVLKLLPARKQTLLFSATMPVTIVKLADSILSNPFKVEVTPVSSTADTIQQSLYYVEKSRKQDLLLHILKKQQMETVLVFTRTKHGADKVVKKLKSAGISSEAIHGNKSQNARQTALTNFKTRKTRVLVATDIAARGIDVDNLSHVINFEIPSTPETYVHRIGRTGRAGANGIALSFCDHEEKSYIKDIHKLIAKNIPVVSDHPYPDK